MISTMIYYSFRKNFLTAVLTFLFTETILMAQGISKTYVLSEFKQASAVIPFKERFQFETFEKGYVYKHTGRKAEAKLNYSYLYGDILFIGPSLDTLSIFDVNLVKNVSIGDNIYYYDLKYGFVEITSEFGGIKVGKKSQLALVDFDNRGRFEKMESAISKPGQTTFVRMPGTTKIENLTNLKLKYKSEYFFIDKNNRFYFAEKDSLFKIYAKNKNKVIVYLNSHNVDYKNEKDLKKVIEDFAGFTELP